MQLISSGGIYGAENMVLQLSTALRRLNCDVVIGAFQNERHPNTEIARVAKDCGFETCLFDCSGRLDLGTVRAIQESLRTKQIQILHAHGYKADFYAQLAIRGSSVKLVSTAHNWPGKSLALRLYALVDRILLRWADQVCVVSPNVEAQLKKYGILPQKLSLIENGVDSGQFSNGKPRLRELPNFDDKKIVGYVGRLAPEKGLHNLIRAVGEILRTRADLVLALIGEGPARIELQSLVTQLNLEKSVFFLGQRSDLADVYASFDIFILPSLIEAMPMAVLEAMAAGKPIIASRVGGIPRMISHQESGILVEPGDIRGLTDALDQLLRQPEKASQLGRRALDAVQSRYSSDAMARGYLRVYQKALGAEASPVTPSTTTASSN